MDLYHHFFNGAQRPDWAGPVSSIDRRRRRDGQPAKSLELAGIVLPVHVPPRHLPLGSLHRHTFGMGLGFPDLSEHLLDPDRREEMSKRWSGMEQMIAEAAANLMGWRGKAHPRQASLSGLPNYALNLLLKGEAPVKGQANQQNRPHPSETLLGEISKVFPIRDPTGTKLRMQTVGSPAAFTLSPFTSSFSRDPRNL